MKFCGVCGCALEDIATFCPSCGSPVEAEEHPTEYLGGYQVTNEKRPVINNPAPNPQYEPAPAAKMPVQQNYTPKSSSSQSIGVDLIFTVLAALAAIVGVLFLLLDVTSVVVGIIILAVALISAITAVIISVKNEAKTKSVNIILCIVYALIFIAFLVLTVVFYMGLGNKGCSSSELSEIMNNGFMTTVHSYSDFSADTNGGETEEESTTTPSGEAETAAPAPETTAPPTTVAVYTPTTVREPVVVAGTELVVNTNRNNLMLRTGKSEDSPVIAKMPKGSRVRVYADYYGDGWVQVVYNGQVGYASAQWLAIVGY